MSVPTFTKEQWLAWRKIGGSDAVHAVGLGGKRLRLWNTMKGLLPPEDVGEDAEAGLELEGAVIEWTCKREKLDLQPPAGYTSLFGESLKGIHDGQACVQLGDFMTATLDGVAWTEERKTCLVEAKCRKVWQRADWDVPKDQIPLGVWFQIVHDMAVSGLDEAVLGVMIGSEELRTFRWTREELEPSFEALMRHELAFWESLKGDVPPDPEGSEDDVKALRALRKSSEPAQEIASLDVSLEGPWHDYLALGEKESAIKKKRTAIKAQILAAMGKSTLGTLPNGDVVKITKAGALSAGKRRDLDNE